jgi:hypothetical protein
MRTYSVFLEPNAKGRRRVVLFSDYHDEVKRLEDENFKLREENKVRRENERKLKATKAVLNLHKSPFSGGLSHLFGKISSRKY